MSSSKGKPSRKRSRARKSRRGALAHPGVWLATLSTVVGIATGMFTLRDQIFPNESGSAEAALRGYRAAVGEVCAAVNGTEAARVENSRLLGARLRRAHTTLARRDLLLDGVNIVVEGAGDELAKLRSEDPPSALTSLHRETVAAWSRNLDLVLAYQHALDDATTPRRLTAAVEILARARPALARGGVTVRSGLLRLGGDQCQLQPSLVTATVTVPEISAHSLNPAKTTHRRPTRRVRPGPTPAPVVPRIRGGD